MVKHMIIWKLKEEIQNKEQVILDIKNSLEGLEGKIEGLIKMNILTQKMPSSSGDIMMDSTFLDAQALKYYQTHPLHLEIANKMVRPNTQTRLSFDFEE